MNNKIQIEREARVHLAKREWDMAIATYRNLLDVSGESPNVYNLIGDVYVKMGDLNAAFKEYLRAINLYTKEGLFENGVAVCKKVLRFKKGEPEIYFRLAELYAKLDLGSDALDVLIAYFKKEQNLDQIKKSIKRYKEIISLISKNEKLLSKVKEVLSELGYKSEELDELLEGVSLNERKSEAIRTGRVNSTTTSVSGNERKAEVSTQKQETKDVKSEIKPLGEKLATEGKKVSPKENMWFLLKVINEIKDALTNGFDIDKGKNHYELGIIYKGLGLYEPAIEELQQATRESDHRLDAFKLLGLCFFENGKPELAVNTFNQGLNEGLLTQNGNDKDHVELHYWLGRAYQLMGDNQKAIKEFEQAYAFDIKYEDVQDRLKSLKGECHDVNQ